MLCSSSFSFYLCLWLRIPQHCPLPIRRRRRIGIRDRGCAAGIALGVLLPDLVNVAGVAPIMIRLANGQVETIAGLGHWPASLPPDVFMREHGGKIPQGVRRTVVPAAPDAWITAFGRPGTQGFCVVP